MNPISILIEAIANATVAANDLGQAIVTAVETGYQQALNYVNTQGGLGQAIVNSAALTNAIVNSVQTGYQQAQQYVQSQGGIGVSVTANPSSSLQSGAAGAATAAQQATAQVQQLGNAAQATGQQANLLQQAFKGFYDLVKSSREVVRAAFAVNEITEAIEVVKSVVDPFFQNLIEQNIELRGQIRGVSAQLAATQDVFVNGKQVTDVVDKIKTASGVVKEQINQLRLDSLKLVGVTTSELLPTFSSLTKASASLGITTGQAEKLTIALNAAASTYNLSRGQAEQEIQAITNGEITVYNQLAKNLHINNGTLQTLIAQGKLYDYIISKTEALTKAQEIAAQDYSGVTSNIREIVQLTTQAAGAPLLDLLLKGLNTFYDLLKKNQSALEEFGVRAANGFVSVANTVSQAFIVLQPVFSTLQQAFGSLADAGLDIVVGVLKSIAEEFVLIVQVAEPFLQVAADIGNLIASAIDTPLGKVIAQFILFRTVMGSLNPLLLGLASSTGIEGVVRGFITFGDILGTLGATGLKGLIPALRTLITGSLPQLIAIIQGVMADTLVSITASVGNLGNALSGLGLKALGSAFIELQTALEGLQLGVTAAGLGQVAGAAGKVALELGGLAAQAALTYIAFQVFNQVFDRFKDGGEEFNKSADKINQKLHDIEVANRKAGEAADDSSLVPDDPAATGAIDGTVQKLNELTDAAGQAVGLPKDFLHITTDAEKSLNDAKVGLDNLTTSSDQAITAAKHLENQIKNGVAPTQEQATATQNGLTAAIDQNKKTLEGLDAKKLGQKAYDDFTAVLKANQKALEDQKNALDKASENVAFKNPPLEKLGNTYKQLTDKINALSNSSKTPIDKDKLKGFEDQIISLTKQQFELGQITAEQAQDRLAGIANDQRVEFSTQQAAQKEITATQKTENDHRTADVKAQLDETQALIEAHRLGQSEGEQRLTALKRQQLQIQLQDVEKELAAEATAVAQGRGSSARVRELTNTQATLQAQLRANDAKGQDDRYKAELSHYDDRQKLLEGSLATGSITEQQYNEQSLANTQAKTDAELRDVQRRRSLLNKTDKQGFEDLASEEAGIRKKQEEAREKFVNDQTARIERAQKKAVDAATLSENERLTQIQKLETDHTITHEQAEQQRANATGEFLKKRLESENNTVIELEKLPKVDDPIKQQQNQEKITAARIKATQTVKELSENELRQQQENQKVFEELLNQRVQAVKNAVQSENTEFTHQENLGNAISKSLDNQNKLLQARKELSTSLADYYSGELSVLEKATTDETERKNVAETIAIVKLRNLKDQQKLESDLLKIQILQTKNSLEQEKIKNRIAQNNNRADIAEGQAKIAEIQRKGDRGEITKSEYYTQIKSAIASYNAKVEEGAGLQQSAALLEQQGQLQEQVGRIQLANLRRSQSVKQREAEYEVAHNDPDSNRRFNEERSVADSIRRDNLPGYGNLYEGLDQFDNYLRRFNEQFNAGYFQDQRTGTPLSQAPAEPTPLRFNTAAAPLQLAPTPNLEQIRQDFVKNPLVVTSGDNKEVIRAIGRLETALERVEIATQNVRSPIINQTNSTNNSFQAGDVDNGVLAKTIEQQQRNIQFQVLKELEIRK